MKLIVAIILILLTGCSTLDVAQRDQLILKVPNELLIPPAPLKPL